MESSAPGLKDTIAPAPICAVSFLASGRSILETPSQRRRSVDKSKARVRSPRLSRKYISEINASGPLRWPHAAHARQRANALQLPPCPAVVIITNARHGPSLHRFFDVLVGWFSAAIVHSFGHCRSRSKRRKRTSNSNYQSLHEAPWQNMSRSHKAILPTLKVKSKKTRPIALLRYHSRSASGSHAMFLRLRQGAT